jgi:hypothetical protein
MLDCLTIDGLEKGKKYQWWISGRDLLQLAQYAVDDINTAGFVARGDGSYDKPWILDGRVNTWLELSKTVRKYTGEARYFWICGRFVKKAEGYYMVDGGGDSTQYGYMAWDMLIFRNKGDTRPDVPFERGGPSYRNFANRLKDIQASSKTTSMESWSQDKAKKLVKVLQADREYADKLSKRGDWTTGQVLPVLAATMFLAEPARNIRCFLINKMLLDMMVTGMTYGGRKTGSAPKQYRLDTLLLRDPQDKGGKMPAAMAGSATAAKPISPNSLALGTGNYTQAKERTVLCHYFNSGRFEGTNESLVDKKTYKQLQLSVNPPLSKNGGVTNPGETLGYMKYLMQQVLHGFSPI